LPRLPKTRGSSAVIAKIIHLPTSAPPATPERLFQEPGVRPSRALGYELHATAVRDSSVPGVSLAFRNTGRLGAVFHVYDKLHLDRIPRRYTVEAGKELKDHWDLDEERYDLWVLGPNPRPGCATTRCADSSNWRSRLLRRSHSSLSPMRTA
jgi:phospholipase C